MIFDRINVGLELSNTRHVVGAEQSKKIEHDDVTGITNGRKNGTIYGTQIHVHAAK